MKGFVHTHPVINMSVLQHYMRYSPNVIFSRDVWAEAYLRFQYGSDIVFDILDLRINEIRFDNKFMAHNYQHFKTLESLSFNTDYINELRRIRSELPVDFLNPAEYVETETHPRHGTADPKRRRRRLKYKNSRYYSIWIEHLKSRQKVFELFTAYDTFLLKQKKVLFYSMPNFNADEFCPRSFQEAIYFFHIFGAPKSGCKDIRKVNLFYKCLLSGFYFERDKLYGAGYLFYERRLVTFQYLETYNYLHRFDKYLSVERLDKESSLMFFMRRFGLGAYNLITNLTNRLHLLYMRFKESSRLRVGKSLNFTRSLWGEMVDTFRLWMAEASPLFAHNERSFVWLFTSLKVEVWFLTIYVWFNELTNESRGAEYVELMPGEAAYFFIDQLTYYLVDVPYDFYQHCKFYMMLPLRPLLDMIFFLPLWLFVDRLYAFYITCKIIKNNCWYSILTLGNKDGYVKGRWWKIPLIVLKWLGKIVLYSIFVSVFIFVVDYRTYIAPVIQFVLPFDVYTEEVFITYILMVFTAGLALFGSFTVKEFIWLEMGPVEWFNVWLANLTWMWANDPYNSPTGSYFPKMLYPDSWEDFSMLETESISVSRDDKAGRLVKTWDPGSNGPKWRHYTFKLDNDIPAWGEENPIIDKFRERKR